MRPYMDLKMNHHHRRSIRLKHYDYSQPGSYFVTICTHDKSPMFGEIVDGEMQLNEFGKIVREEWTKSILIRKEIDFNQWVIMPNHIHGIVIISPVGANGGSPNNINNANNIHRAHSHAPLRMPRLKSKSVGSLIAGFKSITTKRINQIQNTPGQSVWQRNYYEHIIRNERELNRIRRYVINNPPQWQYDRENRNGLPIDEKRTFWSKFLNEFE